MNKGLGLAGLGAFALALAATAPAAAQQSVADFYKGKNIDLYIGYSAGGGYDVYARSLARHMGRFIPGNPTIVPKNMPGAGSLKALQYVDKIGPRMARRSASSIRASSPSPRPIRARSTST